VNGTEEAFELDVGTLFHALLFAYQKATRDLLKSRHGVFVLPTLKTPAKIHYENNSEPSLILFFVVGLKL
jgi:hypothetical protein